MSVGQAAWPCGADSQKVRDSVYRRIEMSGVFFGLKEKFAVWQQF
jgi:hypothetical protein